MTKSRFVFWVHAAAALTAVLFLQIELWRGEDGIFAARGLAAQATAREDDLARAKARNRALRADIAAVRGDKSRVEALARREWGMILPGEVLILPTESR